MEPFKRNIFESSARMPQRYESLAVPMTPTDLNPMQQGPNPLLHPDANVRHKPIPRIGEQK